ncbi:hypothetical protein KC351_g2626 [Hortaea werneckii]|nr:hypothetical protein KC351_g2626 [Hortaea werneckii]
MAFLILFLLALAFGNLALTQLLTTTEFVSTGTCIKRSLLYTSGSSTYMLSEYGSTNNLAAPTQYACNATVTLPPITTTLLLGNAPSPACSSLSGPVSGSQPLISDGGFESGNVIPFNTSSSSSGVSARIVQGGPIAPAAGSNYLLITYGASDSSDLGRRQLAFASVYNLTLSLSTSSGTTYTISANARQAPNGASEPNCYVILCVNDGCGTQAALTADYQLYSYTFTADADERAIASLSFSCSGPAYVGVDNVAAVAVGSGNQPSDYGLTRTITSYATTTQLVTPSINGNQAPPPTVTTTVISTLTVPSSYAVFQNITNSEYHTAERTFTAPGQNLTTERISTVYSTAVHTTTAPASSVLLTTTAVTTSISTIYANITATSASTVFSTEVSYVTATASAIATETSYIYSRDTTTQYLTTTTLAISSHPPDTIVSTNERTLTQLETSYVLSTYYTTVSTTVTYTQNASTITFTPAPETTTLEASIITITQARETTTLEASIVTLTPPRETTTLDASTVTFTPYPETTTLNLTELATLTNVLTSYETDHYANMYCSPLSLKRWLLRDLSAWTVTSSSAGYTELRASGGSPGSYVEAHCDSPATGYGYDNGLLHQTIQTCPGETYTFSYAYIMIDPNFNNYLNAFANGRYIISIRSGDTYSPDSVGNEYGQWHTLSGEFVADSELTTIDVYFNCTSGNTMTFGFDSFFWSAAGPPWYATTYTPTTTTTTTTTTSDAPVQTTSAVGCGTYQICDAPYYCPSQPVHNGADCICFQLTNGGSACVGTYSCGNPCASNADCSASRVCTRTCCGSTCMPFDNNCLNPALPRRVFRSVKRDFEGRNATLYKPGLYKVEGVPYLVPAANLTL